MELNSWEKVNCILCGPGSNEELFWRDSGHGDIVRCKTCGLVYRNPRRPETYLTEYFKKTWSETNNLEGSRSYIVRAVANAILERHPSPGAILDIGAGTGRLLLEIPKTWKRVGVEPCTDACQVARRRVPNACIVNTVFAETDFPERFFDVITLLGTMYYLPSPLKDISRIRHLLKPDGLALIESPNFNNRGHVYRWINHPFYESQVYFYSPSSMEHALNKSGMDVFSRIGLPGQGISSKDFSKRLIARLEYVMTQFFHKVTLGFVDLVPRFVLLARSRLDSF